MAVSHHIGVELADRSLRVVELRSQDGFPSILRAEEGPCALPGDPEAFHAAPFHRSVAKDAVRAITALLLRRPMLSRCVSVALPASVPVILQLPVDARLGENEKRAYIDWACRAHLSLRADVELRAQSLVLRREGDAELHLAVALPAATIAFIRSVFAHLTLELRRLDMAHFIVERALPRFRQVAGETVALLGLAGDRSVASLFRDDEYAGVRVADRDGRGDASHTLLRALQLAMDAAPDRPVRSVHVYGTGGAVAQCPRLAAMLGIPVLPFDPLQAVSFQTQADAAGAARLPDGTFTAAFCAAWNGLSCA